MPDDRRRTLRALVSRARCSFEGASGHRQSAEVLNLGKGGLFLRTDNLWAIGKRLSLEIHVAGQPAPWVALGRVVWERAAPDAHGPPGMGVTLIDVEEDVSDAIERLVTSLQPPRSEPRALGAPEKPLREPTVLGVGRAASGPRERTILGVAGARGVSSMPPRPGRPPAAETPSTETAPGSAKVPVVQATSEGAVASAPAGVQVASEAEEAPVARETAAAPGALETAAAPVAPETATAQVALETAAAQVALGVPVAPAIEIAPVAGAVGRGASLPIDLVTRKPDQSRPAVSSRAEESSKPFANDASVSTEQIADERPRLALLRVDVDGDSEKTDAKITRVAEPAVITEPVQSSKPRWALRLFALLLVSAAGVAGYVFRLHLRAEWRHVHAFARVVWFRLKHH